MNARLLNLILQGITLSSRFFLIFFLAKYLSTSDFGFFGLFSAAVGYCLYFVGLDFYTYVTREIIQTPNNKRAQLLKGQSALSACLYVCLLPLVYIVLVNHTSLPLSLIAWFVPILFLEHVNQEISRLLVALSEQVTASLILFVRYGVWALSVVGILLLHETNKQLDTIMLLWLISGVSAMLLGFKKLHLFGFSGWNSAVDWSWVRRGVSVSLVFLLATLALRGIQTFDRFWLESIGGIEVVGAYVLFIGIAGSLLAFLDAGIFSFTYPLLISLKDQRQFEAVNNNVKKMLQATILFILIFSAISWLVLPFLLQWIGKNEYIKLIDLYPWILLATAINALGLVPHYALYALGLDRPIILSHIASLLLFSAGVFILKNKFGYLAVPLSLVLSFTLILLWKFYAYSQYLVNQNIHHATAKT